MNGTFRAGVATVALIAGFGIAAAQQQQPQSAGSGAQTSGSAPAAVQKPQTAPEQGEPESTPGHSGATNAGLPEAAADKAVFKNGVLTAPGAPQDSQTAPAKYSERNSAIDNKPIMASLSLTDAQKQRIYDSVGASKPQQAGLTVKPSDILPSTVVLRDLPKDVIADVPEVRDLKYAKLADKIVLVRAPNRIVVAEIGK
jgi:hypothetical protein